MGTDGRGCLVPGPARLPGRNAALQATRVRRWWMQWVRGWAGGGGGGVMQKAPLQLRPEPLPVDGLRPSPAPRGTNK